MITGYNELFTSLENTTSEVLKIISSADEKKINVVPFENSWTAAQVVDHITRSINGMGQALSMKGKTTERKPDEKASDLKKMFLDFDKKMKSPPFILPTQDIYEKNLLVDKYRNAINHFMENSRKENLSELLDLSPLGELTKLEVIYFILYHTQRHTQQLKKVLEKVNS